MFILNFLASWSKVALLFIIFVIVVSIAVGGTSDWILMDQISMADNLIKNGTFYSDISSQLPSGVSSYFPGIALIATILLKVGLHTYLPETMTIISILVFFVFVFFQRTIVQKVFHVDVSKFKCFLIVIIFSFTFCSHWIDYTLRFKPDTIALSLGYIGLYLTNFLKNRTDLLRIVLGALIFSLGLIFKQQYLAFIIGVGVYSAFNFNKTNVLFTIFTLVFSTCILLIILENEKAWYWHILTYSDDAIYSFSEFWAIQSFTIVICLLIMVMILIASFNLQINLPFQQYFSVGALRKNLIFWVSLPTLAFCLLGAFKRGGDEGNLELFIIFIVPFFVLILSKVDRKFLTLAAWFVVLIQFGKVPFAFSSYQQASELRTFIESIDTKDQKLILTGSNTYFSSRALIEDSKVVNYWTVALMAEEYTLPEVGFKAVLEENLFDVLVVENHREMGQLIEENKKYKIVFRNDKGIVAVVRKEI